MSAALSVSALGKRYGELEALTDVSFQAGAGELIAVVGPNGAGKTTLLSLIVGVQEPSAGAVSCAAGGPGSAIDPHRTRRKRPRGGSGVGRGVGWVPQHPALYSKLSVTENLELFARLEGVSDTQATVARMLEQTGLGDRAREPVGRLSGGNRQRVNVAIGLIGDPPVLALDEPSASLDPEQRERLWEFVLARVAAGTTVLFSTHNVSEAQRHAGRVLVLAGGRLLFDGSPSALMRQAGDDEDGDLERGLVRFLRAHAPHREGAL